MSKSDALIVVIGAFGSFAAAIDVTLEAAPVSIGRRTPFGGDAPAIVFSASAMASHALSIGIVQAATRVKRVGSSSIELMPSRSPLLLNTGPPAVSREMRR